jgi:hypothetical protein
MGENYLNKIYEEFICSMRLFSNNHRISVSVIEEKYEKIIRDYPLMVSNESERTKNIFNSFMSFYRWDNNLIVRYGEFHTNYNDLLQEIMFNHNKQYQ